MSTSFLIEASVAGLVILLYLFYQYIKLMRELVDLIKEELEKDEDE